MEISFFRFLSPEISAQGPADRSGPVAEASAGEDFSAILSAIAGVSAEPAFDSTTAQGVPEAAGLSQSTGQNKDDAKVMEESGDFLQRDEELTLDSTATKGAPELAVSGLSQATGRVKEEAKAKAEPVQPFALSQALLPGDACDSRPEEVESKETKTDTRPPEELLPLEVKAEEAKPEEPSPEATLLPVMPSKSEAKQGHVFTAVDEEGTAGSSIAEVHEGAGKRTDKLGIKAQIDEKGQANPLKPVSSAPVMASEGMEKASEGNRTDSVKPEGVVNEIKESLLTKSHAHIEAAGVKGTEHFKYSLEADRAAEATPPANEGVMPVLDAQGASQGGLFENDASKTLSEGPFDTASVDAPSTPSVQASFVETIGLEKTSLEKTEGATAGPSREVKEKLESGVRLSLEKGGNEVRMKLHPESLGELTIRLKVDEGVVRAEILVDSFEVKELLSADAATLKEALGTHGLTLDKCSIEVNHPGRNNNPFAERGRDDYRGFAWDNKKEGPGAEEQKHGHKGQYKAASSGIDIFI